jgi:hypothetical protein
MVPAAAAAYVPGLSGSERSRYLFSRSGAIGNVGWRFSDGPKKRVPVRPASACSRGRQSSDADGGYGWRRSEARISQRLAECSCTLADHSLYIIAREAGELLA